MRPKQAQKFVPEDDEVEYAGICTRQIPMNPQLITRETRFIDDDDASTCGSESGQDLRVVRSSAIGAMGREDDSEYDPDQYDDCVAWGFLGKAGMALRFASIARDVSKAES